jgi:hypothetical protein
MRMSERDRLMAIVRKSEYIEDLKNIKRNNDELVNLPAASRGASLAQLKIKLRRSLR